MMKYFLLASLGLAFLTAGLMVNISTADKKKEAKLRHVVLFKFKADATPAQIDEVVGAFAKLPSLISEIQEYEWGTDVSPEKLSKGFTHCFFVTFATDADRDAYLTHPDHVRFVELLKPILDDATVVDYWAK